jgi:hypothetical protein
LHIFGKKQEVVNCALCGKGLGRHKYQPNEEWGIEGSLCGVCHVEKLKEFTLEQKDVPDICAICKTEIVDKQNQYKPRWQWEMESGTLLCKSCYQKKDADYDKKMNFCTICNDKLGMFFYHPKPAWQIEGNLCRKCWDRRNKDNNDNKNG